MVEDIQIDVFTIEYQMQPSICCFHVIFIFIVVLYSIHVSVHSALFHFIVTVCASYSLYLYFTIYNI